MAIIGNTAKETVLVITGNHGHIRLRAEEPLSDGNHPKSENCHITHKLSAEYNLRLMPIGQKSGPLC